MSIGAAFILTGAVLFSLGFVIAVTAQEALTSKAQDRAYTLGGSLVVLAALSAIAGIWVEALL